LPSSLFADIVRPELIDRTSSTQVDTETVATDASYTTPRDSTQLPCTLLSPRSDHWNWPTLNL
jgi:hypothetical protein